jgi:hypothetical protein
MRKLVNVTAEWLEQIARDSCFLERLHDIRLFHDTLSEYDPNNASHDEPEFNQTLFEKTLQLEAIPNERFPNDKLREIIPVEKEIIPIDEEIKPEPENLCEQIHRVLEKYTSKLESLQKLELDDSNITLDQLIEYLVCRMVANEFPLNSEWLDNTPGLNRIAAAILTLFHISKMTEDVVQWGDVLDASESDLTEWNPINLRPDGPLAVDWQSSLDKLRMQINILQMPGLPTLCSRLSRKKKPSRFTVKDVSKLLKIKSRTASIIRNQLSLIITERFLPSLSGLGLRYRYIIKLKNNIQSKELFERPKRVQELEAIGIANLMHGFKPLLTNKDSKGNPMQQHVDVQIHLEPIQSAGPEFDDENVLNFTVDTDLISMRLDLFGRPPEEGRWRVNPWEVETELEKTSFWLKRESPIRTPLQISQKLAVFIGILWAHRGSESSRRRFIKLLGYSHSSFSRNMKYLFKHRLLTTLYHPALELSGLPDVLMFVIRNARKKKLDRIANWFQTTIPFVHLQRSTTGKDMVAYLRFPPNEWGKNGHNMQKELQNELDITEIFILKRRPYFMTVLNRLYNPELQTWRDPFKEV